MKKLLIALLVAAGVVSLAPSAQAGQFARVYTKYGVQTVHKSQLYGGHCYTNRSRYHRGYSNHHRYNPRYRSYAHYPSYRHHHYRTVRSYPVYRSYPRYYSSGYHCNTRPTFSIAFGF